jgi:hypothetical protein
MTKSEKLEKKPATNASPQALQSIETRKETSQKKSAEKATLENHNTSHGGFNHAKVNRGK